MTLAAHATVRFAVPPTTSGSVLLIEDDEHVGRALNRMMTSAGYRVVHVASGAAAIEKVLSQSFDAVISDVNLPGASGVDVLNVVRAYDPDVPLVLMTGAPSVNTALEAVNLGVLEYLVKPTPKEQLLRVLGRVKGARADARSKREERQRREAREANEAPESRARRESVTVSDLSLERVTELRSRETLERDESNESNERVESNDNDASGSDASTIETVRPPSLVVAVDASAGPTARTVPRMHATPVPDTSRSRENESAGTCSSLKAAFERALSTLSVELEPIADTKGKKLLGFATRMFSTEDALTTEAALLAAAEAVGRLEELRRKACALAVTAFADAPADALLFVDIHASDLIDGELYSPEPALAKIADRVVLQVRVRGLTGKDLGARTSVLRFVGFRIAIADLDAGQSCLNEIAELSPEFVKIDARLVRGIDHSVPRRRIVTALVSMCRALDAVSIAEGVSTAEERQALADAGCSAVQGALALRHSPISAKRPGLATAR